METTDEVEIERVCSICASESDVVESQEGEIICDQCVIICERCECVYSINDSMFNVEGQKWCDSCTTRYANYCDEHDGYFTGHTYAACDSSGTFCEGCFDSNVSYCDVCDDYYYNGCPTDHDNDEDGIRLIHDYSYRPDPIFYRLPDEESHRLYFGVEIETEVRGKDYGERTNAAEYASMLENERIAYLKSDGSLNCGFEIVTHPMSHAYMTRDENPLWRVLRTLKQDYNMMSWGTKTCGLHVHVSRSGFAGGSHQHRFLQLVYNNKEFYELFAGRSSSAWAKFDDVDDPETGRKSFKHKLDQSGSDRYSAVNTNNRNTLEMRIFRGSLNPRFVKSAVDLAHASVEYTRVMNVKEVINGGLSCLKFRQYIESKAGLYKSLNERIAIHLNDIQRIERRENVFIGSIESE